LGYKRAINRERPPVDRVEAELADPASFRRRVYEGFRKMLAIRGAEPLFDPEAEQRVLDAEGGVFALERRNGRRRMVCLVNLGGCAARWADPESGGRFALEPFEARIVTAAP
jgi:sucrose phosphorylase